MKKSIWEYKVTTSTIWASFDIGEVEADTREQALEKAKIQVKYDLNKVNHVLASADITSGFRIEIDLDQMEINLKK